MECMDICIVTTEVEWGGGSTGNSFCQGETMDGHFSSSQAISIFYGTLKLCQTLCVCYLTESSRVP
jgi:hypothetical protein